MKACPQQTNVLFQRINLLLNATTEWEMYTKLLTNLSVFHTAMMFALVAWISA